MPWERLVLHLGTEVPLPQDNATPKTVAIVFRPKSSKALEFLPRLIHFAQEKT